MKILGLDTGFGDVKVVYGDSSGIRNIYKFPSVAASVKLNDLVNDSRIVGVDNNNFYVGKEALSVESSSIIDINDYTKLEYFSPLFLHKALLEIGETPEIIVLGLSIAQINNSGNYKAKIQEFLLKGGITSKVFVIPQGAVSKLTIDNYGIDFPEETKEFNKNTNYVIADIGFNTLDVVHVINGITSGNLVRGIEGRGAILIVNDLILSIEKEHGIKLNQSECKDVLRSGMLKRRGKSYPVEHLINEAKSDYINNLKIIIENEFGSILDKIDNLIVLGGGAYILNPGSTDFVKAPQKNAEYYNAIGYYLFGKTQYVR